MRLLLDTHALIWWLRDSPRLSRAARAALADPRCAVFATVVNAYEIANKERLGRLPGGLAGILPQILRRVASRSTRSPSITRSPQADCPGRVVIHGTA
jgi:PIN domain nuclease of toxin-antitoxin system